MPSQRHGHLRLDPNAGNKLLAISPASIDRVLKPVRKTAGSRRRNPRRRNRHHKAVPIRTFADWHGPDPGYLEIDLVAHCGGNMAGSFIQTLAVTDVATGWVEAVPLLAREQTLVTEALGVIGSRLPVSTLGVDSDNDSVFICQTLIDYCRQRGDPSSPVHGRIAPMTRPTSSRRTGRWFDGFAGYERFAGLIAGQALARLFAFVGLYTNLLPTVLQTDLQAEDGATDPKALRPAANSLPAPSRAPRGCRNGQGEVARYPLQVGSALPAQRDQSGPVGPGHIGSPRRTMARCKRMTCHSSSQSSLISGARAMPIQRAGAIANPAGGELTKIPWNTSGPRCSPTCRIIPTPAAPRSCKC